MKKSAIAKSFEKVKSYTHETEKETDWRDVMEAFLFQCPHRLDMEELGCVEQLPEHCDVDGIIGLILIQVHRNHRPLSNEEFNQLLYILKKINILNEHQEDYVLSIVLDMATTRLTCRDRFIFQTYVENQMALADASNFALLKTCNPTLYENIKIFMKNTEVKRVIGLCTGRPWEDEFLDLVVVTDTLPPSVVGHSGFKFIYLKQEDMCGSMALKECLHRLDELRKTPNFSESEMNDIAKSFLCILGSFVRIIHEYGHFCLRRTKDEKILIEAPHKISKSALNVKSKEFKDFLKMTYSMGGCLDDVDNSMEIDYDPGCLVERFVFNGPSPNFFAIKRKMNLFVGGDEWVACREFIFHCIVCLINNQCPKKRYPILFQQNSSCENPNQRSITQRYVYWR